MMKVKDVKAIIEAEDAMIERMQALRKSFLRGLLTEDELLEQTSLAAFLGSSAIAKQIDAPDSGERFYVLSTDLNGHEVDVVWAKNIEEAKKKLLEVCEWLGVPEDTDTSEALDGLLESGQVVLSVFTFAQVLDGVALVNNTYSHVDKYER